MASVRTQYFRDKILNWVKGTAFATAPTGTYLALYTSIPTDAFVSGTPTGTEVSGGSGYTRQGPISWGSITVTANSYDSISNSAAITFTTATGSWGTVTSVGILDASSGGNLLYFGTLTSGSQVVNSGNTVTFPVGSLVIQEN